MLQKSGAGVKLLPEPAPAKHSLAVHARKMQKNSVILPSRMAAGFSGARWALLLLLALLPGCGRDAITVYRIAKADAGQKPEWIVPPGWRETPPTRFLLAKFVTAGGDGAKAEVNVTALNGDGGGLPANVNRWRSQVGLGPVTEAELAQLLAPLDLAGGQVMPLWT